MVRREQVPGTLRTLTDTGRFGHLVDEDGGWTTRGDVHYHDARIHFRGGPLSLTVTRDGSLSTGAAATVKPEPLNLQFIDDSIYMLQASAFSYPNPFQPDEWPKESSGAEAYWDSHYIYMAKINDVVDPETTQAPAYIQLQNMTSWSPWLRMGQIPGRSWGRGFGKKIAGVDDIPAFARADLERRHPQIFELDSWTDLVDEWGDHKREHSAKSES